MGGYEFGVDPDGMEKRTRSKPVLKWTGQDYEKIFNTVGATSGEVHRLEMRPAPIYRLERKELAENDPFVVDGALFAFTGGLGTDPDSLLLIECHKTDDGLSAIGVSPARSSQI